MQSFLAVSQLFIYIRRIYLHPYLSFNNLCKSFVCYQLSYNLNNSIVYLLLSPLFPIITLMPIQYPSMLAGIIKMVFIKTLILLPFSAYISIHARTTLRTFYNTWEQMASSSIIYFLMPFSCLFSLFFCNFPFLLCYNPFMNSIAHYVILCFYFMVIISCTNHFLCSTSPIRNLATIYRIV